MAMERSHQVRPDFTVHTDPPSRLTGVTELQGNTPSSSQSEPQVYQQLAGVLAVKASSMPYAEGAPPQQSERYLLGFPTGRCTNQFRDMPSGTPTDLHGHALGNAVLCAMSGWLS